MEIREEKRIVEQTVRIYISKDGKEFSNPSDCEKHEAALKKSDAMKKIESFRLKALDGIMPINRDGSPCESADYYWFKVDSRDEYLLLNDFYEGWIKEPETYPEIICVEDLGYENYFYTMTNMKELTTTFWADLGYQLEFRSID